MAALLKLPSVHPRRRGDRALSASMGSVCSGSSPQARGSGANTGRWKPLTRFIPAGAGIGNPQRRRSRCFAVHPRRRGDRKAARYNRGFQFGSSPQARGSAADVACRSPFKRFIPAGAGIGSLRLPGSARTAVHPRRRGDRNCCRRSGSWAGGSSPQARGSDLS